jgi:TetR/AcrR family transcriptional repressor of nem operon
MGYSQADKAQSRERILSAACAQIAREGMDSLGVAEVMKDAGLTAGTFYSHFSSRDDLVAAGATRMMQAGHALVEALLEKVKKPSLKAIVDIYFNEEHIRSTEIGCGVCFLVGEARFGGPSVRKAISDQFERSVEQLMPFIGTGAAARRRARAVLASVVGAVNLARAMEDPAVAKDILAATREQILAGS